MFLLNTILLVSTDGAANEAVDTKVLHFQFQHTGCFKISLLFFEKRYTIEKSPENHIKESVIIISWDNLHMAI